MPRPERILLLRSGRHLQTALAALRAREPECEVAVVGTPGSESAIEQAGVPPANVFVYGKRSRFTPAAFFFSSTAVAVRCWRFDRVAVLWNDPDGAGQGNVDRTAFLLAPRGFLAVTPDGSLVERRLSRQVRHEVRRAITSVAMAVMLGVLYLPALLLPSRRS
ncbi:MAG TPA: hypothetical protein VI485_11350 [Vicinamibacterales bacterium]|nr:hypothetical protein [Vicinamibacterales bacterium]